jgi:hypothetical protein
MLMRLGESQAVCLPAFIYRAKREIKHLPLADVLANDTEPQRRASGCTSVHSAVMTPMQQAKLESKQAMAYIYRFPIYATSRDNQRIDRDQLE